MNTENALLSVEKKCTPLPDWETAKRYIRPFLISADKMNKSISLLNDEYLSSYITNRIKMFMVLSYGECIIPLREELLKQWDVTFADIRLAMEDSMTNLLPLTQLEEHNKTVYLLYSSSPAVLLNWSCRSISLFNTLCKRIGRNVLHGNPGTEDCSFVFKTTFTRIQRNSQKRYSADI